MLKLAANAAARLHILFVDTFKRSPCPKLPASVDRFSHRNILSATLAQYLNMYHNWESDAITPIRLHVVHLVIYLLLKILCFFNLTQSVAIFGRNCTVHQVSLHFTSPIQKGQ